MNNYLAVGSSLFLYGMVVLLNLLQLTHLSQEEVFSIILIFYGLITFVKAFDKLKRSGLFLTSVLMNVGIILFVLTHYEILNWYDVITPSLFYVVGSGLIILYLENTSQKIFAFTAAFFLILSFVSIIYLKSMWVIAVMHRITLILFDFWPLFFILFGVMLIVTKPNRLSSGGSVSNTSK